MDDGLDGMTWLRLPGMLCTSEVFTAVDPWLEVGECRDLDLSGRSLAEAARDLLLEVERIPGPVGAIGLSLGAIVTMAAAAQAPDALAAMVLVSTNARSSRADQRAAWHASAQRVEAGRFDQVVEDHAATMWAPERATAPRVDHAAAMAEAVGADRYLDQLAVQHSRSDLRAALQVVSAPTLVVAGEQDLLCQVERHEEIAAALPAATLRVLPGLGHLLTIEDPIGAATTINAWWRETAHVAASPPLKTPAPTTRRA
ncbi:alpha/beta fold hydrolase [Nocardioides albus]|uniref:Pimeloyl-ACP methyl ester carboxylesterase n=1 Tax=Nocardioides albus TaxID=1841 RepID=A0A7W5F887_9ACTN|nr:alpha/beta hydrolase [Nocardioides albus]MBB3088647.1 pimeloyl-ACP methyl ester carboxylesterase [Nocardioides albus]GGU17651.1 alpha/beta hydrolase fold protein [Nocardioides albus]